MNTSQNALTLPLRIASYALLAGLLVYPFSIAASNLCFGILLSCSVLDPRVIKNGLSICWHDYKGISIGIIAFISCTIIGTAWSTNIVAASHLVGKQVYWLLIPCIVGLNHLVPQVKRKMFFFLSLGLFLHLILATMQSFGVITIPSNGIGGSSASDPTGYLGHLTFGFIYSIWAGLLIVYAKATPLYYKYKVSLYFIAAYAFLMVFLAQGRGGYLISIVIIILLIWKILSPQQNKLKLALLIIASLSSGLIATNITHIKNRIAYTTTPIQSLLNGNWQDTAPRIKIWGATIEIWTNNPYLGIGTGSFRQEFEHLVDNPKFAYLHSQGQYYTTAHNEYLFSLVRWGPLGLLAVFFLFFMIMKSGLTHNWERRPVNAYLMTATALSLILNSFTDVTLSGYDTLIFSILMLSLSMERKL